MYIILSVEHFVDQFPHTYIFSLTSTFSWLCNASVLINSFTCADHCPLAAGTGSAAAILWLHPLALRLTLRGQAFENKITIITCASILMGKRSC